MSFGSAVHGDGNIHVCVCCHNTHYITNLDGFCEYCWTHCPGSEGEHIRCSRGGRKVVKVFQ